MSYYQISIFDELPKYKITKKIRLIELFAGIGSQAKALERLKANFEHYKVVEFDKYAIKSYNAIHGTDFETSDITQIHANDLEIKETNQYEYIMTYSFPCQDLSLAGKQRGMSKGSGTRSGLLWEVERLLDECEELPQILLMENVPEVIGNKNIKDFQKWQQKLESLGYSNYVKILNAKDYVIPQNRKRCFMVSILGNYKYEFPKPFQLELRLKDMLQSEVDEKFYLSAKMIAFFIKNEKKQKEKGNGFRFTITDGNCIAKAITTRAGGRMDDNFIKVKGNIKNWKQRGVVYDIDGVGPTLCATDYKTPKLIAENIIDSFRIRKLTPLECWRLMGFDDEDFEKASKVNSNTQLYKQAGNSIVVNVLFYIFKNLI